jgi:hypothetical protein
LPSEEKPLQGNLRIAAVAAAALIVAVVALLLLSGGDDDEPEPEPAPPAASVATEPEIVTAADLSRLSAELGHPLYWLGQRPGAALELSRKGNGDVYVRYLTGGAKAGDPHPRFVTVGTYPIPDALAAVKNAAANADTKPLPLDHGGLAFVNPDSPSSVYFAYPGAHFQVEVFAPKPGEGLELITGGKVVPAG